MSFLLTQANFRVFMRSELRDVPKVISESSPELMLSFRALRKSSRRDIHARSLGRIRLDILP
jgi:hypothetical protein